MESAAVVVMNLQLEERTLAHRVPGFKFSGGSLMRKTRICNTPAVTAYIINMHAGGVLHARIVAVLGDG